MKKTKLLKIFSGHFFKFICSFHLILMIGLLFFVSTTNFSNAAKLPDDHISGGAQVSIGSEKMFDGFEYEPYENSVDKVRITKYYGNSSKITVPAKLNDKLVVAIGENAFSDNDYLTEITFADDPERDVLRFDTFSFNRVTNLETINIPDIGLVIFDSTWKNCLKLKTLTIGDNTQFQYRFYDGGLYYYNGRDWELRSYLPGAEAEVFTVPPECVRVDCNFTENSYLKVINLHDNVTGFPFIQYMNKELEAVNVSDNNPYAFSVDGVLFTKDWQDNYSISLYPPEKKDKTFTVPENVRFSVMAIKNNYLETLTLPNNSTLDSQFALFEENINFPNLKTIYLQNGSPYEEFAKDTFRGEIIMYD